NLLGHRWRFCEIGEVAKIHAGVLSQIFEVHKLRQVAILNVVFHPYILMLMSIILIHFGNSHCSEAPLYIGNVITPAQKTIIAIYHYNLKILYIPLSNFLYTPG